MVILVKLTVKISHHGHGDLCLNKKRSPLAHAFENLVLS